MKAMSRFGDLFQLSYVAQNRERAVELAAARFGIDNFHLFDGRSPVVSRGVVQDLHLRVAVANTGRHQFEIIEPVSGPVWIYTDGKDLARQTMMLHHVAIAVLGPYSQWQETLAQLQADGDEIVQVSALPPGQEPQAMFAYVDNRRTLGHFTEYLWWSPALNGAPTMPHILQG